MKFFTEYKNEIWGLCRHIITIIGGVLIAKGTITTDSYHMILGATTSIAGTGWSVFNKIQHKRAVKDALATDPVSGEKTRKHNAETNTWESI